MKTIKRGGMDQLHIKTCRIHFVLVSIICGFLIFFNPLAAFSSENGVVSRFKKATVKPEQKTMIEEGIPIPKNIVKAIIPYQGGEFFTEMRKDKIKRFKCSSCHNNETVNIDKAADITHADIKMVHGEKDKALACNTCHNEKDRDYLTTGKGEAIDMDHVYNMCGQCHFRQKKDWIGGAHGRRVSYWAGERVVKNCTSCHNPHSPRFEKRMPATYSVPLK